MIGWWISDSRRLGVQAHGLLRAHKWWLLRRISQLSVLGLFVLGPMAGIWIARGNFAASEIGGVVTLGDPYIVVQSLFGGSVPALPVAGGALIVLLFYLVVGGRVYCGWVCPVNVVTDAAHWLREKTGSVLLPVLLHNYGNAVFMLV